MLPVLGAIAVLAVASGWLLANRVGARTRTSERPCAVADASFISGEPVHAMRQIVDAHMTTFPGPGGGMAGHPNAIAKAFVAGRSVGYLAEKAITGPDRPAEDAYARSLNYPIRELPLYPLSGQVVAHNPQTLLELYQTNFVFKDDVAASGWINSVSATARGTPKGTPGAPTQVDLRLGSTAVAFHRFEGPNDGEHESVYEVAARFGRITVQLSIQGGPAFTDAQARLLAQAALRASENACGMT